MNTTVKYPHITVKLVGADGNAFSIMGRVMSALRRGDVLFEEQILQSISKPSKSNIADTTKLQTISIRSHSILLS